MVLGTSDIYGDNFLHIYPSQAVVPEVLTTEGLEQPSLRSMLEAWERIRGNKDFPERPEPMLRAIKHLLKFVLLSTVVGEGRDFQFRILGASVFPGLEPNQTGRLVSQHPDAGISHRFSTLMRATVEKRSAVRGVSARVTGDDLYDFEIESIWLPFGTGVKVTQILSMSTFTPRQRKPGVSPIDQLLARQ
jgi:hypothetical protein